MSATASLFSDLCSPTSDSRLCPDCESREIAPDEKVCVICWFARNDENPDGRWVNTQHAGWLYE